MNLPLGETPGALFLTQKPVFYIVATWQTIGGITVTEELEGLELKAYRLIESLNTTTSLLQVAEALGYYRPSIGRDKKTDAKFKAGARKPTEKVLDQLIKKNLVAQCGDSYFPTAWIRRRPA